MVLPEAVLYLRASKSIQEASVPDQRKELTTWSVGKYVIINEYVDDGKSGSKDTWKREAFLKMLKDLTIGKYQQVKYVICLDTSRFARLDSVRGGKYKEQLADARIKFDSPTDGMIDWNKSMDRIVDCVKSEGNHALAQLIGEKSLRGRIRATKAGRPNQTTPYGMAKQVTSPTGEQIIIKRGQPFSTPKTWESVFTSGDSAEVEAVKYMFTTFLQEDLSMNQLAFRVHEKGYPSPTGIGWQGQYVACMLANPVYAGGLLIGGQSKGAFFRHANGNSAPKAEAGKSDPTVAWGKHTGIIDRPTWDQVQSKLKKNFKARRPARRNGPYALTGVIHCGNCGRPMYGSKRYDGKSIYRCHRQEVDRSSTCGYWIAYESDLLPFVLEKFLPDLGEHVREQVFTSFDSRPMSQEDDKNQKELEVLDKKLETARQRYLDAPSGVAQGLLARLEQMEAERSQLASEIKPKIEYDGSLAALKWWYAYEGQFADGAVELPVPSVRVEGGRFTACQLGAIEVKVKMSAAALREKLRQIDCKMSVWFQKKKKGIGYDLAKVRVQADVIGLVSYEYSAKADS